MVDADMVTGVLRRQESGNPDDPRVIDVPSISPLRLLRTKAMKNMGCRWFWQIVYPDGAVNRITWHTKKDAIGQAMFAVPYHRRNNAVS